MSDSQDRNSSSQPGKASVLLASALNHYQENNPKSAARNARASLVMPAGNTRATFVHEPFPISMQSGKDCYLTSLDDVEYVDFVSEYFAGMYGHSHPDIKTALEDALRDGFNFGAPSTVEVEFAEAITSRFPSMDMIQFCTSGTEANTIAIAVALNYTKRKKVLVFQNAYHGNTLSFKNHNALMLPHEFVFAPYNDIEGSRQMINVDIGVILVEPVQGGSGMVPATKEFLSFLRETATKVGAVLLFDEVVTSRLSYGGMQSYHNIVPDMTTVGKFFGGGLAFGAYGGRREIMDTLDTRQKGALAHSGTWHNNRFTMFTGLAATKLLSVEIIERTNQLGDKAREDLKRILGGLATVNGFGSVIGVRFGGLDPATLLSAFYFFLLSRKVYVGHRGFICLNIMHRESDVEQLLQAVMAFVEQLV